MLVAAVAAWSGTSADAATNSTLYVDGSASNCSDAGPGSSTQPFCTISRGAAVAVAGQTVQVASGTYREHVKVANSGTADAPITIAAAQHADVTVTGGSFGFTVSDKTYVVIRGFTVTDTKWYGFQLVGSSHVTVEDNHVSDAGQPVSGETAAGIYLKTTTASSVVDNVAEHNTDAGILLTTGATGNLIQGNITRDNARQYTRAAPGISVRYGAGDNTLADNVTYDNEDSGINFVQSSGNAVVDNLAYDNGDHGIDSRDTPGQVIVGNTVYGNVTAGINLEGTVTHGGSTNATLANNVSVDNGINSPRTSSNIRVDTLSAQGTSVDYDLVYLDGGGIQLIWGKTGYTSLAAFQAAHPDQERHGLQADPRFKNPAGGDFQLRPFSPAIDSANSAAPDEPDTDIVGNHRVDVLLVRNSGAGPRRYDDRGAYEYQPWFIIFRNGVRTGRR